MGAALLKNFFLATIAYVLILLLIVIGNLDLLMDSLSDWNLQPIIAAVILGICLLWEFIRLLRIRWQGFGMPELRRA